MGATAMGIATGIAIATETGATATSENATDVARTTESATVHATGEAVTGMKGATNPTPGTEMSARRPRRPTLGPRRGQRRLRRPTLGPRRTDTAAATRTGQRRWRRHRDGKWCEEGGRCQPKALQQRPLRPRPLR